jgi:hypothetical protein
VGSFKPGHPKLGGREKGTPNKITLTVKEQIEKCYQEIGGDKAFSDWARANPEPFYVHIYPKIIPKDIHVSGTIGVAQLLIEAGEAMKLVQAREVTQMPSSVPIAELPVTPSVVVPSAPTSPTP